ncbi:MAG: ImmA/IrrE family metallo-endopeptidase [Acetobacteraceae bacterium]
MPFTAASFGRKLASLRVDFAQDLAAISSSSGIPTERLSALEAGVEEPTGDEVLILADCFRKDFRFFLTDDAQDPDAGVELLFRERGDVLSTSDRIAIAEFVYLCRSQAALEHDLGVVPAAHGFVFHPRGSYFVRHGEQCAQALRDHLRIDRKQVLRDVFAAMREMGIKVFRRRLENSAISGLYMNHPEAGACVLVNLAEGLSRQRFSAAHEWGHGLMDQSPITMSMIGEWDSNTLLELRANTFASRLLIPPALLQTVDRTKWSDPREVSAWAARLRVSVPALLSALTAARLIDSAQREALRAAAPRPPDPPDPDLEGVSVPSQLNRKQALLERGLSKNYVDLCFDAYSRGAISRGLLSEMLLTTPAETHEIATLFGRSFSRA